MAVKTEREIEHYSNLQQAWLNGEGIDLCVDDLQWPAWVTGGVSKGIWKKLFQLYKLCRFTIY